MEQVRSEDTKAKIKASMSETRARRKSQICRVFEIKVSISHNSKSVFEKLSNCFNEAKWVINDMLSLSKVNPGNSIFDYKYTEHRVVVHYDKDKNPVTSSISLPSVLHRAVVAQKKTDIVNLAKAKKKGFNVGALKFKSEVNCIPIITGFTKILDASHITIPGFRKLKVNGLHQIEFEEYELADAKLIRKASGYYVKLTIMLPKEPRNRTRKSVGLDFGIKNTITTSDNKTYDCKVQETEYLKYLSKMLNRHKKEKDSKRRWNCRKQLASEHEHVANIRKDICNKIYHDLVSNYDVIYIQDEQIKNWHQTWFSKQVQQSCMGSLKQRIKMLVKADRAFVLSKWLPTTKMCPVCGAVNQIGLDERTYHCDCGYSKPRDWHSACNVLLFGTTKRYECVEHASAEVVSSMQSSSTGLAQATPLKRKLEAHSLKAVGSSLQKKVNTKRKVNL